MNTTWQFSVRPAVPEYCRCTPADGTMFLKKPVSSTTRIASGSPRLSATHWRWRTSSSTSSASNSIRFSIRWMRSGPAWPTSSVSSRRSCVSAFVDLDAEDAVVACAGICATSRGAVGVRGDEPQGSVGSDLDRTDAALEVDDRIGGCGVAVDGELPEPLTAEGADSQRSLGICGPGRAGVVRVDHRDRFLASRPGGAFGVRPPVVGACPQYVHLVSGAVPEF